MKNVVKQSPLVSVIIPIYNVEKYIKACVESITAQTYKRLEIILVNDGSTDLSGILLDEFKIKDQRIKVIHKENGGVSSARNIGLNNAKGDFVMFIDSDDWIDENMIEQMTHVAMHYNLDIVSCGMRFVNVKGVAREIPYNYHPLGHKLNTRNSCLEIVKELIYGGGSLCCRLINRNIISTERFINEMRVSEDQEWLFRIAKKAESMMYIPNVFYNIRVRAGSATTKSYSSDILDIEVVDKEIVVWAQENNMANNKFLLNALFVRSRLKYTSAIRASIELNELLSLKQGMKSAYKQTKDLPRTEIMKYYLALLPPQVYPTIRKVLKTIKKES